jgi:hypothetical protein
MHHCRICERCCVKFDHHCGMAINCIGINNYHLFALFLTVTLLDLGVSLLVNLASLVPQWPSYGKLEAALCIVLALHNAGTLFYNFQLARWYLGMAARNMHAVEELMIGQLYDKARFHKLPFSERRFYYTRQGGGWLENMSEMMGTRNVLRWLLPMPYFGRQYATLTTHRDEEGVSTQAASSSQEVAG